MQEFKATLEELTSYLKTPDLIKRLKEEASDRAFWATVDLQALVQRRVMRQALGNL
jgi:hypothetical protein